jgi:hypothetical protein
VSALLIRSKGEDGGLDVFLDGQQIADQLTPDGLSIAVTHRGIAATLTYRVDEVDADDVTVVTK